MLSRSGGRWVRTTNAKPLPAGRDLKNCSSASTPPAEAPMPTMGRLGIMVFTLRAYASFILLPVFTPLKRMFGASVPGVVPGDPPELVQRDPGTLAYQGSLC